MFDCVCVRERGCVFVVDLEVVSPEKHCWGHGAKLERRRGEGSQQPDWMCSASVRVRGSKSNRLNDSSHPDR